MSSFEDIKAEEAMLNLRLRQLNQQRAEYGRVIHTIQCIPRARRTAEQKKLFREQKSLCKELDMQMQPMRKRYRELQEAYPHIKKAHRLRLQQEHRQTIQARKDVDQALCALLDVPSLIESSIDVYVLAAILDQFEEIIRSEFEATYSAQITSLQSEVRQFKQQIAAVQDAARTRVAEAEERFDRLRGMMRSLWSQRVPANADEQARRYSSRILLTKAWEHDLEDALGL